MLTETAPDDLLAATQLGFLLYARGEQIAAEPLFERVLAGKDEDLANRVRAVLRIPQVLKARGRLYEGCAEVPADCPRRRPRRF